MQWVHGGAGPVDLSSAYAWPEQGPWMRAMMVMSLDGVIAGPDGKSGSISSKTDRDIMNVVRDGAQAVLIGASTMRAERYSPMRRDAVLVMVSLSLNLPWDAPVFRESMHTPIVLTGTHADSNALRIAQTHARVVQRPGLGENASQIVAALHEEGLERIVCEGGAQLLGSLVEVGAVDEFDVAVSPVLMFEGQPLLDATLPSPVQLELVHAISDDGFVFTKYVRRLP
jgi:riboflavin biosynthesis pyrimidine reductase